MEGIEKRRKGPLGTAKATRRKNKNGMKVKEEKMNPVGPDPGGGQGMQDFGDGNASVPTPSKSLQDELLLNGGDIKGDNPTTPQIMDKQDCNTDMMSHPDIGHPDFHDCKTPMNPYCYPQYNSMPPGNGQGPSHPGEFGPPPHHHGPPGMMGGYPPPNCPPPGQPPPPPPQQTKQQPSTLEAQYMQQQSQIFVFSTKLANKAAEAVFQGQFPSIIAFHNTHPATRKFMEYQGNSNWQPPPPQPTGKMSKGNKGQSQQHMIPAPPPNMPPDFNPQQGHPPPPPWNPQQKQPPPQGYPNYYEGGGGPPFCGPGMGQSPCPGGPGDQMMGPGASPMGPNHGPGNVSQPPYFGGPGGDNSSNHLSSGRLTGVQIRDEDLTPEERARREAKLANLSTIGRMLLFQENERGGEHNCHPGPPPENMDGYNPQGGPPPGSAEYMHGPNNKMPPNDWPGGPGPGFFDGQGMKPQGPTGPPLPPPPNANGSKKGGGGSIPSPVTPLTPSSSCGGAPHRPSPHSPISGDPMYPGPGSHSFYPSGYYSPQVGQVQDNSPSGAVQRKDSESSNSEGGKSRKEKSSCSISPTSSAPPSVKEANLMPVPSPQQIQYLNVFEGQELTIQKQPNVGLPEHATETSPSMPHSVQGQEMNPSTPNLNQQKPSHSSPPTPVSVSSANNQKCTPEMPINSNNSNSSKPRPGSVGPIGTPRNSTTPNPSPQAMDRNPSQPGTPLQMNMPDMKNPNPPFGPPGHPGGGLQSPCNPMMKPMPMMDPSDGPSSGGVFDNVPLNPNLAGPGPPSKPAFDPISSMVQMSQQLGGNGNSSNPQGSGMTGPGYGMNPPGGPPMNPNMVNFNTSMHSIQSVDGGMAMGGPQTVNNTYVSATMTIQQMNIQNMPPYMNNGPNNMGPNMGPMGHQMGPMGQQMGIGQHMNPMGGPGNMGPQMMGGGPPQNMPNHMGPGGPMGGGPPMGPMCGGGPPMPGRGPPPPQMLYGNQPMPPRMSGGGGQGVRGSPYRMPNNGGGGGGGGPRAFGGANVQVKPNAPNTIQYLPARPPPPHNQGQMCSPPNAMGGPMHGQPRPGPNLDFLHRYTNPSPGPVVNVNMGMNVNVNMGGGNRMNYPGPPQPGMGGNHGMCGPMGPMRPPAPHGMLDQGPEGPGGVNPGNGQPLPPHGMGMGGPGGPGPGMKGPGGYGPPPNSSNGPPPPNDPAYAQQFHHFQQQLYATGSNNVRNSMQSNQGNPNNPQNQPFFK